MGPGPPEALLHSTARILCNHDGKNVDACISKGGPGRPAHQSRFVDEDIEVQKSA